MKKYQEQYSEKLVTAAEAAKQVKPGDWIDIGMFLSKSVAFERELANRKDELRDIVLFSAVSLPPVPDVLMKDPTGDVFTYVDYHFSPLSRIAQEKRSNVFYNPVQFGEAERWFGIGPNDPDKIGTRAREWCAVRVAPMDKDGYFNFGLSNGITLSLLESASKTVVEVCPDMPYGCGGSRERIHISDVDYIIEETSTVIDVPPAEPTDIDRQIATHVLDHIHDGCTLQLGIGGMPNALGKIISETDLKDLGGHTEMLSDAYMHMMESGKMNNKKKAQDRGRTAYTFAIGTKEMYDWMHQNTALASYNVEYVNDPINLSRIDNLISINQALQVDLYTQVSAESSGFKHISGNGGMLDFVLGSFYSHGGRSLICLPSTHTDKKGKVTSRIVPSFETGTITTIPRQCVNIIVTEHGWASFKGDSTWVRTEKLINIAHPDFREELIKAAEERKIWRRSNRKD